LDEARRRRGVVASVGVWIVVFNLLAAALLGATAKAEASPPGLDGDRIVICTGFGMVTLDRDGQPIDSGHDQRQSLCPFCLPMAQGPAMVPAPAAALAAPLAGVRVAAKPCLRVPPPLARAVRAAPSRAPPVA
jgi:hypothetical protein